MIIIVAGLKSVCAHKRTCGDDVEYAGVGLLAGGIAGPAQNRAVVGLADGLVGEHALGVPGRVLVAGLRYVRHLLGVVEGPVELVRRRISLDPADNLCLLLSRHPVDALLIGQADRLVCKDNEHHQLPRARCVSLKPQLLADWARLKHIADSAASITPHAPIACISRAICIILTHDLEFDAVAVAVALDVAGDARVVARLRAVHLAQCQACLLHDHPHLRVVLQHVALSSKQIIRRNDI